MKEHFRIFACRIAEMVGSAYSFGVASIVIIAWAVTGPVFHYSDTWQLFINTGTTIITFLMVFLIQYAQNRDTKAMQLKLNELIHGVQGARNELVDLEEMSDEELERLREEYRTMYSQLHKTFESRKKDKTLKSTPEIQHHH